MVRYKHGSPRKNEMFTIRGINKNYKISRGLLNNIKATQKSTRLCIPKASFLRLVKELIQERCGTQTNMRVQSAAIAALHEATEMYLIGLFEDSEICAMHAKRITLKPNDMQLVLKIREGRYGAQK